MDYKINNSEFVLLLLIGEGEACTGYAMRRLVEERGYAAWSGVSISSIYVTLKKIEKRGMVRSRPDLDKTTKGPSGRLFELTPDGHRALTEALVEALSSAREFDPRYNIAVSGVEFLDHDTVREAFAARHRHLGETLASLDALSRSEPLPLSADLLYGRILSGLRAEIHWMEEVRKKL